jgi:hypothetical protein
MKPVLLEVRYPMQQQIVFNAGVLAFILSGLVSIPIFGRQAAD